MQLFDIILFAFIAIFLVLRLRGVLGNRDGFERDENDQPEQPDNQDNVVTMNRVQEAPDEGDDPADEHVQAPDLEKEYPGPLGKGLKAIQRQDPQFDPKEFLDGSRWAFEMILNAYADGDVKTLKGLLSAEVYGGFAQAIDDREAADQTLQETLVGIGKVELMEAYMEGKEAQVTIKFVSEQISALLDSDGVVIEGDPVKVISATDFWTFARSTKSKNPNWTLVGTGALD